MHGNKKPPKKTSLNVFPVVFLLFEPIGTIKSPKTPSPPGPGFTLLLSQK